MQRIRKELNESNSDYEGTAARKPHWSFWWETLVFVDEIPTMIDNGSSMSIRYIARDMELFAFFIRQVVQEDIQYFLYKMRKSHFFTSHKVQRLKNCTEKVLNKLKHPLQQNMPRFFSVVCTVPTRCTNIDENQTPSLHHCAWDGREWWWCYTSIHGLPSQL